MPTPRLLLCLLVLALAAGPLSGASVAQTADGDVEVLILSGRGDLVVGGDALVEVVVPDGASADGLAVEVDGRDVTGAFGATEDGRIVGLVDGLGVGGNRITATLADGRGAYIDVDNHPIGGPVFSGPQIQPWTCVGEVLDDQCNRPTTYAWFYKSTDPRESGLQEYDPENPPDDVATTTTDQGNEVPFIVREETGVMVRDEYKIAVLFDPQQPWTPQRPQKGYNNKLVLTHGASCDTDYIMGEAPDVLLEDALSRGFAVGSHALDNSGHNCHVVTQAESLLTVKERVAEQFGPIRYTIGNGCSGGALAQQWVSNSYPGVYQGITPACSFTDSYSSGMEREDYTLLRNYFERPERWQPGVVWSPQEISQVYDHPNVTNPITYTELIPPNADPSRECTGVAPEDVYDAETNPEGVRCSIQDYWRNVFGLEVDGTKAGRPADNTGIQYGLRALNEGRILPQQYVDVNVKIGSHDIDYNHQLERREADPIALERVFRSGGANIATNMDEVAIIDLRGPDPGAFHDVYRTYAMRERLIREHGTAENQVLWRGQVALFGDPNFEDESIVAMDSWLAAIEADDRDIPLAQKIIEDKPETVTDRCTDGAGQDVPASVCDGTVQSYGTPRFQAGMPLADDTIKCQLQEHRREDYDVTFSDAQWEALQAVFPSGVCDYTKPSVGKVDTVPWLDYTGGPGGEPMGDPPVSVPFGPGDAPANVRRYGGVGRVETAAAVSGLGRTAAETVVIARADAFPDALAGGPLANQLDAPLLLSDPAALSEGTRAEIGRLGATSAILLGGTAALSDQVVADLEELGLQVERVSGRTRYATAAAISARLASDGARVFLASGEGFPDALSAAGVASALGAPVLLTTAGELPEETAAALDGETDVTVVGGRGAVSDVVLAEVDGLARTVTRLSGPDRYATSAAVARQALTDGANPAVTWIATGRDFPDGLVAGAAAGRDNGLLLLVDGQGLSGSSATRDVLAEQAGSITALRIAGGRAAVTEAVEAELAALL